MTESTAKKKLHPGWMIIITMLLLMSLVYAPCINMVGLFYVPMSQELNVSIPAIGLATTLSFFISIPACIFAGKFFTVAKVRTIELVMLVIIAGTFVVNGLVSNLTVFYICAVVRGFCSPMCPIIALSILSDRWFGPKARGKALGIATMGSGLGQMILSPITATIIENFSWRFGYFFLAVLSVIMIPLVYFTIKESPESCGVGRIGEADPGEANQIVGNKIYGPTLKGVLTSPVFWLGFFAMFIMCNGTQTMLSLGSTFFQTYGFSAVTAATLMSCGSIGIMLGKLILGWVIDKFGLRVGLPLGSLLMTVGYAIMLVNMTSGSFIIMAVGSVFYGLGCAVCNLAIPMFTSALVGTRAYSMSVSLIQLSTSLGAGLLPTVFSATAESTGSYALCWGAAMVFPFVAAILISVCLAIRAKRPAASLG